jgi:hypothetical protein
VSVTGHHVSAVELLHHNHRRQVREGNVGLVTVSLSQIDGPIKAISPYPLDIQEVVPTGRFNLLIPFSGDFERKTFKEKREDLGENVVRRANDFVFPESVLEIGHDLLVVGLAAIPHL